MTAEPTVVPPAAPPVALSPDPSGPSRRQVLCGLAVALLAPGGLAAACGGGSTDTGTSTGGRAAPPPQASGTVLAKVADVPVGGGLIVEGPNGAVLVVQPAAGTVKAYDPTCTHQGTQVREPEDGTIVCPRHGSEFDAADGTARNGPATQPLAAVPVRVDGDSVVIA